jgi:cobalt/nickel transport system permease protein
LVAYPLLYRPIAGDGASPSRVAIGAVVAAVVGLQLGAFGVVLQTVASGISSLPFSTFLLLMLPIHLAIGLVEGLATVVIVLFIRRARPDLLVASRGASSSRAKLKPLLAALGVAALVIGGTLSWFASSQPDGLEWSIERAAGSAELAAPEGGVHGMLARLQQAVSFLPDYSLPNAAHAAEAETSGEPAWPAVDGGTSLAGVVGGAVTLALIWVLASLLKRRRR